MLKKLALLVVCGLLLTTFVSYAFAQCNAAQGTKDQKGRMVCQCCGCCKCCK